MSLVLRPRKPKHPDLIPIIAALAVTEALEMHGVKVRIKWPNDIIVNGRKLAGILCESSVVGERFQWVIVGIGINVNNLPPKLPGLASKFQPISIIQITGEEMTLLPLANSIKDALIRHYDNLQAGGDKAILDTYNAQSILRNRNVSVSLQDQTLEGAAGQVDTDGRLSLKSTNGSIHKLRSEDVLLLETL
jgi:BirA family transcriptional regulator, biotin operon repressor / biotin---[acetyl-CoA-carboxylase] ligase